LIFSDTENKFLLRHSAGC